MLGFMLLFYYAMLLGLPLAVVAVAYRSAHWRGSLRSMQTRSHGWQPISWLGTSTHEDERRISRLHVVVLVHGWLGNPLEMGYLKQSLCQSVLRRQQDRSATAPISSSTQVRLSDNPIAVATFSKNQTQAFVIHSAECNAGPVLTSDGIEMGGKRVAMEVDALISHYANQCSDKHLKEITLSLVGNSLGGLYARYAISEMHTLRLNRRTNGAQVTPKFFVTTCTPHLGVSKHTFIKIPTWLEAPIARVMQQTGLDLFRRSDVIQDMTVKTPFLQPLLSFPRRIALANVYGTDFQVPTSTAAFWANTDSIHKVVGPEGTQSNHNIVLQLQTPQGKDAFVTSYPKHRLSDDELSTRLDEVGWTKILVDVRHHMPITGRIVGSDTVDETKRLLAKNTWTARDLLKEFHSEVFRHIPLGHTVTVANSKGRLNAYFTQGGKPTMDYLAETMIRELHDV
jgi:hypothetical protein